MFIPLIYKLNLIVLAIITTQNVLCSDCLKIKAEKDKFIMPKGVSIIVEIEKKINLYYFAYDNLYSYICQYINMCDTKYIIWEEFKNSTLSNIKKWIDYDIDMQFLMLNSFYKCNHNNNNGLLLVQEKATKFFNEVEITINKFLNASYKVIENINNNYKTRTRMYDMNLFLLFKLSENIYNNLGYKIFTLSENENTEKKVIKKELQNLINIIFKHVALNLLNREFNCSLINECMDNTSLVFDNIKHKYLRSLMSIFRNKKFEAESYKKFKLIFVNELKELDSQNKYKFARISNQYIDFKLRWIDLIP